MKKMRISRKLGVLPLYFGVAAASIHILLFLVRHPLPEVVDLAPDFNQQHRKYGPKSPRLANQTSRLKKQISTPSVTTHQMTENSIGNFSACLLVMDDNHFLIEWLAYHSFVVPLSRVIVAVDPRSRTSPKAIAKRWEGLMDVQVWQNDDYTTPSERADAELFAEVQFKIRDRPTLIKHRARQRLFYYKCMKRLKEEGQQWVLLIDTDEYLRLNYDVVSRDAVPMHQFGSVGRYLAEKEAQISADSTISPCLQIPRLRFGNEDNQHRVESGPHRITSLLLADEPTDLATLRWRNHISSNNPASSRHISKTVINLQHVAAGGLELVYSVHRPIRKLCTRAGLYNKPQDSDLVINHYLGSWEQYKSRNDAREGSDRSYDTFRKIAQTNGTVSDHIVPWINGFVKKHGEHQARMLLQNVGRVETRGD